MNDDKLPFLYTKETREYSGERRYLKCVEVSLVEQGCLTS